MPSGFDGDILNRTPVHVIRPKILQESLNAPLFFSHPDGHQARTIPLGTDNCFMMLAMRKESNTASLSSPQFPRSKEYKDGLSYPRF